MKHIKKGFLLSFAAATLGGALLQYLYRLLPNAVTALFSPINGSIWEMIKILYWPLLIVALYYKVKYKTSGGRMAVIPVACLVFYVLSFLRHITCAKPIGFFDAALFVLLMALALAIAPAFGRALDGRFRVPVALLAAVLGAALILFTFLPPDNVSFVDFESVNTWSVIPF